MGSIVHCVDFLGEFALVLPGTQFVSVRGMLHKLKRNKLG